MEGNRSEMNSSRCSKAAKKHGDSQTQSTFVAEGDDAENSDIEIVVDSPWLERDFESFELEEGEEDEEDEKRNIDHKFLSGGWEEM